MFPGTKPCCCDQCEVEASDDFERDDSTTVSGWTEVSGDWEIVSGSLRGVDPGDGTLDSDHLITFDSTSAHDGYRVLANVLLPSGSVSGDVHLVAHYVDSNNYHFAKLSINAGTGAGELDVGRLRAGVEVEAGSNIGAGTLSLDTTYQVELCLAKIWESTNYYAWQLSAVLSDADGEILTVSVGDPFLGTSTLFTDFAPTGKAGVRLDSGSPIWRIDDFTIAPESAEVSECPSCRSACDVCGDAPPAQMEVTLDGIAVFFGCGDCDDLNGTYTLEYGGGCYWSIPLGSITCDYEALVLRVQASQVTVQLYAKANNGTPLVTWRKTDTFSDCDFDELAVSYLSSVTPGCSVSSSTCTVSAAA